MPGADPAPVRPMQVPLCMTDTTLLITALNRCIEACVDAERAYGIAAAEVRDPSLKSQFQRRADERLAFVIALQDAVRRLGAFPTNQGTFRGAVRRRFMELEQGIEPRHDPHRVLADLLREEQATLDAYRLALPESRVEDMPEDVRVMVREQRGALEIGLAELSHRLAA
jgi:uncharacterized protein (TIGR02284 family)